MNLTEKTYEPMRYESDIYQLWEQGDFFAIDKTAKDGEKRPIFSQILPPPNANGNLHIGHGLTIAIEDILTRYHRMNGYKTEWIPGSDHAGFETWSVFEKYLEEQGDSRFNHPQSELYQMTWDFVQQHKGNMEVQLRQLGASVDWNKMTFTLDDKVIARVYKTFKKLWDDGLVYRGKRIVNFCTKHQTAFADIEVVYTEEHGHLWEIKYAISGKENEFITVATTRPETMLGDEAIAVHPDDEQYKKLVGKSVIMPITGKKIPIIADEAVELGFGTGAVKITPAHDPLDFEIGERHKLPLTEIISHEGKMINTPAEFLGLGVDEARDLVVESLKEQGSLGEIKKFTHQVPHCYKCDSIIQPLAREQWFIRVEKLAREAKKAVKQINFVPKHKGEELERYFTELRDWNISRQIPWGISIPVFQSDGGEWIVDINASGDIIEKNGKTYTRDTDTFDTWFSSGQWPLALTQNNSGDAQNETYPLTIMETGFDILRAWIARMIMLGVYITNEIPFKSVYLHGMVLDEKSQKMSKSKGNVINPMTVVEEFGSDAFRIGIVSARSAAASQAFSPDKVIAGRNFCNKLWNISRFITSQKLETAEQGDFDADHWILWRLQQATNDLHKLIGEYRFAEAVEVLYHTIWNEVADWWIESLKGRESAICGEVLEIILKLTHPFAPFVSETIWQATRDDADKNPLITAQWDFEWNYDEKLAKQFEQKRQVIVATRNAEKNKKELAETEKKIANLENRLKNKAYIENAPKNIVDATKLELAEAQELAKTLARSLQNA